MTLTTLAGTRMIRNSHDQIRVNSRPRPTGFTLVELLIVLVIIAVLFAIIFPLAARMRESAKSAQCVQNLRQIGIGLHGFITDNNGRLPNGKAHVSWLRDDSNSPLGLSWYDAAAGNLGRQSYSMKFKDPNAQPLPDVFCCPAGHGKPYHPEWPYTGDYAANLYLGNPDHKVMTYTSIKNPASTPYVQDTVKQNNFGANIFTEGFSRTADFAFADRHAGRGNVLWVDGHVSSFTYNEYAKYANDPKHGGAYNFLRGNW